MLGKSGQKRGHCSVNSHVLPFTSDRNAFQKIYRPYLRKISSMYTRQVIEVQKSTVKTAAKVMYVMGVYTFVMSLFWIFLTEVVFVSDFLAYTGQSYGDFLAASPKTAELYIITKKLFGVALLLISLLIMLITRKSYSRGEKWSWYALLTAGVGLWGSLIGYRIVIGYIAPSIVTFLIGAALFVIGIALPARAILRGKST